MDRQSRRRFVPTSDDLEVRKLLTTTAVYSSTSTNTDLAITFQQKQDRIENLPKHMLGLQANRFIPKDTMAQIQAGLTQLSGELDKPNPAVLNNFNITLRKIVPSPSFSQGSARKLHQAFVQVLQAAHAPQGAIDQLSTAVNDLASRVDTASIQPTFLASNDYTIVLQTALSVGKPLPRPQLPQIAKNTGIQVNATTIRTSEARPYFTGTYAKGTTIQIVNAQGDVLGQAATNNIGQYKVRLTTPLAPATYSIYARAEDMGHLSDTSHVFTVTVVPSKK